MKEPKSSTNTYPSPKEHQDAKDSAIRWAKEVIEQGADILYLDTETSGYSSDESSEILQISITGSNHKPILSTLIKPVIWDGFPNGAFDVHGIGEEDYRYAPTFAQIAPVISKILEGRRVIIYNRQFDEAMIRKEFARTGLVEPVWHPDCLMLQYAKYNNVWNKKKGGWKWPKLPLGDVNSFAHDATTDCISSTLLVERIAGIETDRPISLDF